MQALGHPGRNYFKFIEWTLFGMESMNPLPHPEYYASHQSIFHGGVIVTDDGFIPKTLIPQALSGAQLEWNGHTACGLPARDQFYKFQFPKKEDDPAIHMSWSDSPCWETCWNGGFLLQDAIVSEEIETFIIQHQWMEDDCEFADLLLPVSTLPEVDDIGLDKDSGQFTMFYRSDRAIDPVFDSKCDYEIVFEVAKTLEKLHGGVYTGLFENFTQGQHDFDFALSLAHKHSSIPEHDPSYTLEDFKAGKFYAIPTKEHWEDDPAGMIEFYEDPDGHPLTTPSGKLEFYSSALQYYFPDDEVRGPVAHWIEETEVHKERVTSERAKEYPFLLVSNHPRWRLHAQLDDVPWFRELHTSKILGPDGYSYEPLWMNPIDADRLGLKTGDVVKLFNERGNVLGGLDVTERIMPGVVYQDHGARVDTIIRGTGGLDRGGANNLIAPSGTTSKNCAGEVTSGFLVGVEKVDVFELARDYPERFNHSYDAGCGLVIDSRIVEGAGA
jgi:trimethylamine-N-oxide reductase (cytochrome c)